MSFPILISDDWLAQVKKVLAYPLERETPLLPDTDLIQLCVWPAMMEYFLKFPKTSIYTAAIGGDSEIGVPFPDPTVYGVVYADVVGKNFQTSSAGSSFWNLVFYNRYGGGLASGNTSAYGTRRQRVGFNPNFVRQQLDNYRYVIDTISNRATIKRRVDKTSRILFIYSSTQAEIAVVWAQFSYDFTNDVVFQHKTDVIRLAQAEALHHFADATEIAIDGNSEQTLGTADIRARADSLRQAVVDKWAEIPTSPLLLRVA